MKHVDSYQPVPQRLTVADPSLALAEDLPPVLGEVCYFGRPKRVVEFDFQQFVSLAESADVTLDILVGVGDMVDDRQKVVLIRGHKGTMPKEVMLRRCIKVSPQRTMEQDPRYAIRLIVDIAIRALSPAINDPTTAVQALDQLDDLLRRIATRDLDIGFLYDRQGILRVRFPTPDWDDFLTLAINEIRHYGATSHQVMRRLYALLSDLRQSIPSNRIPAVEHQLSRVDDTITRAFPDPEDQVLAREPDRQGISVVK